MSEPDDLCDALRRLNLQLRHADEQAEARLEGLNRGLRELHRLGLVGRVAVPGPVVLIRPFPETARQPDGGQVVQAVLTLPTGVGAVYWETEAWIEVLHRPDGWGEEALRQATPFEDCEPAVRALLAPHAAGLLEDLLRQIRLRRPAG